MIHDNCHFTTVKIQTTSWPSGPKLDSKLLEKLLQTFEATTNTSAGASWFKLMKAFGFHKLSVLQSFRVLGTVDEKKVLKMMF
eukprot:jgi/Bigna1/138353/aug1.44_g13061